MPTVKVCTPLPQQHNFTSMKTSIQILYSAFVNYKPANSSTLSNMLNGNLHFTCLQQYFTKTVVLVSCKPEMIFHWHSLNVKKTH